MNKMITIGNCRFYYKVIPSYVDILQSVAVSGRYSNDKTEVLLKDTDISPSGYIYPKVLFRLYKEYSRKYLKYPTAYGEAVTGYNRIPRRFGWK